ncbi:MlaD family protein [Gordonia sp. PKS22-38]|uniref:MlaD family protein n=1 Tax=Gordonia prachuapensis TaxID=3115651 RepID=A0ABU7MMR4_9ACTN|nr:MlaD family protein [Gordonia sp. PKS22-38]
MTAGRPTGRRSVTIRVIALLMAGWWLTGCSAYAYFSPEELPTPQSVRTGWMLNVEVPTAVNLPLASRVTVNGIESGVVSDIVPATGHTVIRLLLDDAQPVSAEATLELKQDTLLGDTYVAITNPPNPSRTALPTGGTLPESQVERPVQIEQLMVSLSNFLGSGDLMQLGNTFSTVNNQFPQDPAEVRKIQAILTDTVNTWADSTGDITSILRNVTALTEKLKSMKSTLEFTLSQGGVDQFRAMSDTTYLVVVLARLQRALGPAMPLVPVLTSLTQLVNNVAKPMLIPGWPDNDVSNAELFVDVLHDKLVPYFKNAPGLNIRSLAIEHNVSDREIAGQMANVFRMLGMTR